MKKQIKIIDGHITGNNELHLQTNEKGNLDAYHAAGQILVDSEHYSFVYLVEKDDEYTYVVMDDKLWPLLKEAMDQNLSVYMKNGEGELELVDFIEEITYLIENIKGNSNYGAAMVQKVETLF